VRKADLRRFRKLLREFERLLPHSYEGACGCTGVSVAQCHVLLGIEEMESASVTALAAELELDRSTVSRTVDSLVARGLVARKENPEDRRSARLVLTPAGHTAVRAIHRENDAYFRKVFMAIPEDRRLEVVEGFELLLAALRSR